MSIKINKITIRNILGIDELTFDAGKFTTVTGKNASGKTSIMKAIKSVFAGGHDATLLRKGAETGEVVFVLNDGTSITKKVSKDKSELKATGQKAAQSYVSAISDLVSVNPISFLLGDDKTRLKILLESMPIELPVERLEEIIGESLPDGQPLEVLGSIRKRVYDDRTGVNRAIKEKQSTINQLSATLGEFSGRTNLQEQLDKEEKEYRLKLQDFQKDKNEYQAELYEEIEKIKARYGESIEKVERAEREYSNTAFASIAELREAVKHEAVAQHTREMIEMHSTELASYKEDVQNLESALTEIDRIKVELLENTPFKGLTIQDGKIYIDGVAFEHLNTASQVAFVIKLARLRAGELGFVCLDNMESLDADTLGYFKAAAAKTDLQFIITRVGESDLTITNN